MCQNNKNNAITKMRGKVPSKNGFIKQITINRQLFIKKNKIKKNTHTHKTSNSQAKKKTIIFYENKKGFLDHYKIMLYIVYPFKS